MQNIESTAKSLASSMPRNVLFIVNPNAGKRISERIVATIKREFPKSINFQIVIWENKDKFDEITDLLKSGSFTDAVAVGGDGTVNEVAKSILNTSIRLGIIPIGSGNGLARSLGLSMKIETTIKQLVEGRSVVIDSGTINGKNFFCTSGVGFDAHISYLFASSKSRGLKSYVKIILQQLFLYRAEEYTLAFEGQTLVRKAFLITVANAGQYGNDFYIAPQALLDDGLFHVVILKPFNVFQLPAMFVKILRRKAHTSRAIETFVTNHLTIKRTKEDSIHFDGEPSLQGQELAFVNEKQSLHVIVGKSK
ncbi:MAG: YegS/Rv2252/BmrU family lipid kinase [bacterium]|nr:YegS/Rv2252/BmrU family lipid kinase [bacterium]